MKDKKTFYGDDYSIPFRTKSRMWRNIKRELRPERKSILSVIEFRSFAFGMAAAVILFFTVVGVKTTLSGYIESKKPVTQKINNVYSETIDRFEKTLPIVSVDGSSSIKDQRLIPVKMEELRTIDEAITIFKDDMGKNDNSPVKQTKLRELYKMKLQILNELLAMEGNRI